MRVSFWDNLSREVKRKRLEWQNLFIKSYIKFSFILLLLAGGGFLLYERGGEAGDFIYEGAYAASLSMGFMIDVVDVEGVRYTDEADLRSVLSEVEGNSLMFLDIADLRGRLQSLGWVREVSVRRIFPDGLRVSIVEQKPAALWQVGGRHHLITSDGVVISDKVASDFGDLLLLVGEGANLRLADLRSVLSGSDFLFKRYQAAVWIGSRRWDIHLDNGVVVKLPAEDAAGAWRRLGDVVREELLLEHENISVLDMRLGGRLVIKFTDEEKL